MSAVEEIKETAGKNYLTLSDGAWFRLMGLLWLALFYAALPSDFWSGKPFDATVQQTALTQCAREALGTEVTAAEVQYWISRQNQ